MVPDPIELMESSIDRCIDAYEDGACMCCGEKVGEENLIGMSPTGDGPVYCYPCAGLA